MAPANDIVEKSSKFVDTLLREKNPDWAVYHSYDHTLETVEAARRIADGSKLNKSETEVVLLAAWFHDTGYTEKTVGHEQRSSEIAREFLSSEGYPPEKVEEVVRCIMATRVPQHPADLLEQVVCDADMEHVGRKRFFKKNDLMRTEIECRDGKLMTDLEWLEISVQFATSHKFHTGFAQQEYGPRRTKNIMRLQEELRSLTTAREESSAKNEKKEDLLRNKLEKANRPERGIETMFRVVPRNHIELTGMADSKAHMIITTNSLIVSLVIALLFKQLGTNPHLIYPIVMVFVVSLTAIIFAVLATRPKITKGKFTREDIEKKQANLLFFGNYHQMSLGDFEWGMKQMMNDREYLYSSMIRDLHSLGKILARKYRYLRLSFDVFMYGFILSVIAFLIAILAGPTDFS